jgi:hypothetical protein
LDPDADDVGIVGQEDFVVIGKQTELLRIALAIGEDDGSLPASLLVGVEFAQVSDDLLARSRFRAGAFDQSEVSRLLPSLGAGVAT